uniref:Uncharacterized protein n=1 Tax=uncultured marine microorganism HF4000_APKG10K24 TaxID=455562 RepID=B3TCG9_9ZZZZ|nr:hypothetical protein ALOHA_HF4000APKG10K24ctg1g9 [uncultured marine microorganism HF4000_APKG10K24]
MYGTSRVNLGVRPADGLPPLVIPASARIQKVRYLLPYVQWVNGGPAKLIAVIHCYPVTLNPESVSIGLDPSARIRRELVSAWNSPH